MWLALLYSVLAIGARFIPSNTSTHNSPFAPDPMHTARMAFYREKAVQALILANYTKCPPYTVEACLVYFGSEFARSSDAQFSMWILVGMIIRVALRMGYHREPSKFANISVFKAELRRRTWLVILSIDLVSSAQVGLPRIIQPFMYDTLEPRNLPEDALFEDMSTLPPSLPETELTPLLYSIVTTRVRTAHAKVMDLMNATSLPPYREIMSLDAILRYVYDSLPASCKAMSTSSFDLAADPSSLRRLYLGLSFLKAELMLHRPYHLPGRTDARYEYSRRVCLNAASEMLEFQTKLDEEITPGGKLWSPGWQIFTMSWYMSSVVAQDFLLATTVLILDLDEDLTAPAPVGAGAPTSGLKLDRGPPGKDRIIQLLRAAQAIWIKASRRSHEARKVAEAIRLVLSKVDSSELNELNELGGLDEQRSAPVPPSQHTAFSPPSYDLSDFGAETGGPEFFGMGVYANPFAGSDMPMDLGSYTDTFNWVRIALFHFVLFCDVM
jgi:hypothetical protein